MFVNRKQELAQLEHLYHSGRAELFVLYGRRRVGKTELLRKFCEDKPHLFFIATLSSEKEQLSIFSQQIYGFNHDIVPANFTYPTWESAFLALSDLPNQQSPRPVVILDEFTYLISGNKAIPSILQKVWDERLKNSSILLILCGSYIGMMETEVLGYQAPLYGRRTASHLLRPLDLPAAAQFFPDYSPDQSFLAWSVLGGMPYYLCTFQSDQDLFTNIRQHILNPDTGTLYSEPRLLLMEELREPRNYFSILRAIAQGRTRLNEIAQAAGLNEVTSVGRYLDILQQLKLVTRNVPVTESQPEKSKRGLYQINDHFLRFWFRYVHPNQASLDLGLSDAVLEQRIRPDFDHFAAAPFEEASRNHIVRLIQSGRIPFLPERVGSWWERDVEIDVVAINDSERAALVGECKWSVHPVGISVFAELKEKARLLSQSTRIENFQYVLYARSGFTADMKHAAEEEGVRLYTVDNLVGSLAPDD